jgi:hypothetical protein
MRACIRFRSESLYKPYMPCANAPMMQSSQKCVKRENSSYQGNFQVKGRGGGGMAAAASILGA